MNTRATPLKLGIDVGGVIIDSVTDSADTSFFGDQYLLTPQVPDAFDVIAALVKGLFAGEGYVVSKCGKNTERKTREWLSHNGFHGITEIPPERVHFCRTREEKAPICAQLGITHFVDNRLEVLSIEALERAVADIEGRLGELLIPFRWATRLLKTIPGVSDVVAQVIVSEIGVDMGRFPSAGHLVSWTGLCPRLDESAGKRRSTRVRHGAPWLKTVMVQAAWAGSRKRDSYLHAQ